MNFKSKDLFSGANILLLVLNLIAFNLVAREWFSRLDLTENRVYTLSKVSKSILRGLEEPLTIKAYFTRDLPIPYNNISHYVEDQLAEMKANSRGNLRFEFLDPTDEEELKKEAEKFRLEPMQVNEMRADRVEMKLAYMGMVLLYEDRQEVIPAVQSLENLEYEIISKIKRVTSEEASTIGFLEGHDEPKLREKMTRLDQELRKIYDIKSVDLTARNSIPEDIDLLVVVSPQKDIPEADRLGIDQFLMRGGKLMLCINKVSTEIQTMSANRGALRIDPWTEHYGFRINDDLVLDRRAPTLPFQTMTQFGRQITYVMYPLFPEVVDFNRDIIALAALRQVRFYFPSSIDTTLTAEMDSVTITPLFFSSEKSGTQNAPYDINPLSRQIGLLFDQSRIPIGALVQGSFSSYWAGRDIPVDEEGNKVWDEEIIQRSPDTRILVIGDGNFLQDQFIVPGLDNLTMALNLIDWLAQDEDLISIRSKEVGSRPISEVSDTARRTVKYANMALPPIIVILFGLIRWRTRRAARKMALKDIMIDSKGGKN